MLGGPADCPQPLWQKCGSCYQTPSSAPLLKAVFRTDGAGDLVLGCSITRGRGAVAEGAVTCGGVKHLPLTSLVSPQSHSGLCSPCIVLTSCIYFV